MKKGSLWAIGLVIILVLSSLAGCSGDTTTSPTPTTSPTEAQAGGTLKILSASGSPQNLSYVGFVDNPNDWVYALPATETLLGVDPDGEYYPILASSWEVSDDGNSMLFHLQENVIFHDGTDFNAQAVKDCLDVAKGGIAPEIPSFISSVDVVDEFTVRINTGHYDSGLLSALTLVSQARMISPTALAEGQEWCSTHVVGTGPFKFVEYKTDVSITYERWDSYWGAEPYLDEIEYIHFARLHLRFGIL